GQLVHHLVVQGVQRGGAVDGDEGDGVAEVEEEGFVGHGGNATTGTRKWELGTRNSGPDGRVPVPPSAFRLPRSVERAPTGRPSSPTRPSLRSWLGRAPTRFPRPESPRSG